MKPAAPYQELNAELNEQLARTAVFRRAAFHVHSPESYDWARGPGADPTLNDRTRLLGSPVEVLDHLAESFDVVCVTDHMRSGFATQLAGLASNRDDITVFPGVEVSLRGAQLGSSFIHVLAVFPPSTQVGAIERIYGPHASGSFPTEGDRTGREVLHLDATLKEFVDAIRREGGMFIVAHVDEESRGHRSRFRVTREGSLALHVTSGDSPEAREVDQQTAEEYFSYLAELKPDAVEIMNPSDRHHYAKFTLPDGQVCRLPCVSRSDHHSLEDLRRDDLTTHVKVSRPAFDCVRDALRFFETRIRFKDDLPPVPCPRLVGLRLRSPSTNGLFEDALIAFNPNLNCIIGSRGTGKSTLIEALRYVLGLNSALEELRGASGQITFTDLASETQRANLKDTLIELVYELETGERNCLSATFEPDSTGTTSVYTLDGELRPVALSALAGEFPVRLYSWSEIETLGREPELQRTLLDRLVPGLAPLAENRSRLAGLLASNRLDVEGATQKLSQLLAANNGLVRRYRQYKADFEQVNTEEVAALFGDLDLARQRLQALRDLEAVLLHRRSLLLAAEQDNDPGSSDALASMPDSVREWWRTDVEPDLNLTLLVDEVARVLRTARGLVDGRLATLAERIAREEAAVAGTESSLRAKTQTNPEEEVLRDQREERRGRYERATDARDRYLTAYADLEELLLLRRDDLADLERAEADITKLREVSRNDLMDKLNEADTGMKIGIRLDSHADRDNAIHYMRDSGFLGRDPFGQYQKKKIAERCCRMARPIQIARAILKKDPGLLEADGVRFGDDGALTQAEGSQLVDHFHPYAWDEDAEVSVVSAETLLAVLKLEEQLIDDRVRILLDGKAIDRRSPGQRSSAMLPLVALSETAPLVIDQPEDNLDNRMVGQTLTKILATLKERRQIIVTTHNPNIVVGGDAEQVVVLESDDEHEAHVEATGSIDDPLIIEAVVAIIEGGREAFAARNRRYGPAAPPEATAETSDPGASPPPSA